MVSYCDGNHEGYGELPDLYQIISIFREVKSNSKPNLLKIVATETRV